MNRDSIYLPRDVIGLLQTLQSAGHTAMWWAAACVTACWAAPRGLGHLYLGPAGGDAPPVCRPSADFDRRKARHGGGGAHGKPYEMTTYRLDGNYQPPPSRTRCSSWTTCQGPGPAGFYHQRHGLRPGQGIIDLYGGRMTWRRA